MTGETSRIDQQDFTALVVLDKFACENMLSWYVQGGDNGEMNFWLELKGIAEGEYFRAKKAPSIASAVECVLDKAGEFYDSLQKSRSV